MSERSDLSDRSAVLGRHTGPRPRGGDALLEQLFGWEFARAGTYAGRLTRSVLRRPPERGCDVAGVGSLADESAGSAWSTYISVDDVDDAVRRATDAGAALLAGPVQASPAGRLAVLADPTGAVFGVWEPEQRQGAQLVNEPSAWAMSALQTSDSDAAKRFYAELFGWQAEPLDMGGLEGTLWRLPGYVGGEPHQPVPRDVVAVMVPLGGEGQPQWTVDFWIDDADAAAAKAPELGGTVLAPAHDAAGFRQAVLADPHGAVFSVSTLHA